GGGREVMVKAAMFVEGNDEQSIRPAGSVAQRLVNVVDQSLSVEQVRRAVKRDREIRRMHVVLWPKQQAVKITRLNERVARQSPVLCVLVEPVHMKEAVLLVIEAGVRVKPLIEQECEAGEQALTMVDAPAHPSLFKQIENRLLVVDFDADIPLMLACGPFVINVSARSARMDERTVGKSFGRNRGEPMIADGVSVGQSINHRQGLR